MRIDWWTLALQTINATVLIWLLGYFLFKPIANVIAERRAAVARLLDDAEQAKSAAVATRDRENAALADIAESRSKVLDAAQEEAKTQRDALLAAAKRDAERVREEAREQVVRDTKTARATQMKHASGLALDIAKRLAERFPESARVFGFIEGLAHAAQALSPQTKQDFERPDAARLLAPRALTAEEEAECRRALEHAFGRPLDFSIEVDPSLIAGLELANRHGVLQNSLRADLARIADSLDDDD